MRPRDPVTEEVIGAAIEVLLLNFHVPIRREGIRRLIC
jgi:hypothetical protein